MEIDALRKKVIDECERCFTPRPLNMNIHRNQPDKVKDAELREHIVEVAIKNIKEVLYKKFNDTIASISKERNNDSENTEQSGDVLSPKDRIEKYVNSTCNGYASTRFSDLFKDGSLAFEEENKRAKIVTGKFDARTIRSFINQKTIPDEKTLDLFSVFLRFSGWNTFKNWIREQQYLNGDNPITPIIDIPQSLFSKEKLKISGATIINKDFFENIKIQKFSRTEFYTGMYDVDCQWFGVMQGWDVERQHFEEIKNKIKNVFESRKTLKVSFVVHGNGGVGKTCFLRRIVKELHQENSFTILWLHNKIDHFLEEGLKIIEENSDNNFLIFIEDWEKAFGKKDSAIVNDFLEETKNLQNLRIIIGDRKINKDYGSFLNNDIEPLLLSTEENRYLIEKIVENNTEWREVSEKLFENPENYNASLFLLLFVIAHVNKEGQKGSSYDLSEARTIFKNIIESDLEFIAQKYEGLAKSLYYFGCLYSEYRIYITYETFLEIADYFNGDKKISELFSRWDIEEPFLKKLKLYITKREAEVFKKKRNFVLFNHDVFCDYGISRIQVEKWDTFSDAIILEIMDIIIEGDNYCASQFLESMLLHRAEFFKNDNEKLELIEKVLVNEDVSYQHLLRVYHANLILQSERWRNLEGFSVQDLLIRADREIVLNFSNNLFESSDWQIDFMHLQYYCWHNADSEVKHNFANKILKDTEDLFFFNIGIDNLLEYASDEIATEFSNLSLINFFRMGVGTYELSSFLNYATPEMVHHFCREVIMVYFIENFSADTYFIHVVFRSTPKDIISEFYEEYLTNDQWKSLDARVVEYCLQYGDQKKSSEFTNKILVEEFENWENYSYLFEYVLHYANKEIVQDFSEKILLNTAIEETERGLVLKCIGFSTNEVRNIFCEKILLSEKWKLLESVIVKRCITYAPPATRNKFSNSLLTEDLWEQVNHTIVIECIEYSSPKIKSQFINTVLSDGKWKTVASSVVNHCIRNSVEKVQKNFTVEILSGEDWKFCDSSTIEICFKNSSDKMIKDFCNKVFKEDYLSYREIHEVCSSRYKKFELNALLEKIDQRYDDKK